MESVIEQFWIVLENVQEILDGLILFFVEVGDEFGKNEVIEELEIIEKEVQSVIEVG